MVTSAQSDTQGLLNAKCGSGYAPRGNPTYNGFPVDGMNSAGLSVGCLTDLADEMPPSLYMYNASVNLPTLFYADLAAYLLSNYATVAEVRGRVGMYMDAGIEERERTLGEW